MHDAEVEARVVDEHGTAVILKNDVPRHRVIDFSKTAQVKSHLACYRDKTGKIW